MTKKHFILIANVVVDVIIHGYVFKKYRTALIFAFANMLKRTNPRFDSKRFSDYIEGEINYAEEVN